MSERGSRGMLCAALVAVGCGPQPLEWTVLQEDMDGVILSFWGPSTTDVWAVGGTLVTGGGDALVLHHDADGWWRVQAPTPTLWWIHGFDDGQIVAVGEAGTVARLEGGAFVVERTGEPYTLFGVWGAAPDDVWAVGGDVSGAGPGVILHYDGAAWIPAAGVATDRELFFKVWGTASDDVYVVGQGGTILHFDGSAWRRMAWEGGARLLTVRGREPGDVWAVGGLSPGVLLHLEEGGWRSRADMSTGGLMGLWTAPGQPVVVSGFSGLTMTTDGDGELMASEPVTFEDLHAVWGDGAGSYLAGGGNLVTGLDPRGVIIGHGGVAPGAIRPWPAE